MKKTFSRLLALTLTLLLTLALLPAPAVYAAPAYDADDYVLPAPSNLTLSFYGNGNASFSFSNNLIPVHPSFDQTNRFFFVFELYNAENDQLVLSQNRFFISNDAVTFGNTGIIPNLAAGRYYAKVYNWLAFTSTSQIVKKKSESAVSSVVEYTPGQDVTSIDFSVLNLNPKPGDKIKRSDYKLVDNAPYSIDFVTVKRYSIGGSPSEEGALFWNSAQTSTSKIKSYEAGYSYFLLIGISGTLSGNYKWASFTGLTARVNGEEITPDYHTFDKNTGLVYLEIPLAFTLSSPIPAAEVTGATLTLPEGSLPAFSGKVPADANYEIAYEMWSDEDGRSVTSDGDRNATLEGDGNLMPEPEKGKTYSYSVALRPKTAAYSFPDDPSTLTFSLNGNVVPLNGRNLSLTQDVLLIRDLASYTIPDAPQQAEVPPVIEPTYYPDYPAESASSNRNEDAAPADAPAPAAPARDESDTAPKTADAPVLPALALAALCALLLSAAAKRLCR